MTSTPESTGPARSVPRVSDHRPDAPTLPASIHAPWRMQYLEELGAKEKAAGGAPSTGSFLLDYWRDPAHDENNHVLVRSTVGMVLLNAFPYATGHLLVALGDARASLLDYTPAQRSALWRHVDCAAALMRAAFEPQGINIGINQGRAAGAGVPSHLHAHLVPRWGGDVNFISVVGQVRVIPAALEHTAQRYRTAWQTLRTEWEPLLSAG